MKKPLSHFRQMTHTTIAKLDGMKSIMRVTTPRTYQWWLVLPAIGGKDSQCVKLDSIDRKAEFKGGPYEQSHINGRENLLLKEYSDRIIRPKRPAFPTAKPGDLAYEGFTAEEEAKMEADRAAAEKHWTITK